VSPPTFESEQFAGVFFDDVTAVLNGPRPTPNRPDAFPQIAQVDSSTPANSPANSPAPATAADDAMEDNEWRWELVISPNSIEDLIKGIKLKLDQSITTPAAFKGGGFAEARREFSLAALLFAIIENYRGQIRWQSSAGIAREAFTRVAANTKIGSDQVYQEAKNRLLDLNDLLNGSSLVGEVRTEADWSTLIDRGPLMQLMEWAYDDHLAKLTASEAEFESNPDAVLRYAELITVLGRVAIAEGMPDASDDDYTQFAAEMMANAQQVVLAVKNKDADLARKANGQIGQSCSKCHDNFR
jgi:hypothetical protein